MSSGCLGCDGEVVGDEDVAEVLEVLSRRCSGGRDDEGGVFVFVFD